MDMELAKFVNYGKRVTETSSGRTYVVKDAECRLHVPLEKESVKCVESCYLRRYELLKVWSKNQGGLSDEERAEMVSYEKELPLKDLEPADTVRFITPNYETIFEVNDLSLVFIDDKPYRVVYLDEAHMELCTPDGSAGLGVYHICEFAEWCRRRGSRVEPDMSTPESNKKLRGR